MRFQKITATLICAALLLALPLSACSLRVEQAVPQTAEQMNSLRESLTPEPQPQPEPEPEPQPEPAPPPEPEPLTGDALLTAQAQEILDGMTLDQKVGQMFFVRCPEEDGVRLMEEYQFGGYLLFLRDFKDAAGAWLTAEQFYATLASYRDAAAIAPFFGVDEEGGTVARASRNPNLFPGGKAKSPQELLASGGENALLEDAITKNSTLLRHGINVNFAPVADVTTDKNAFMYARAIGADAETTAQMVETIVSGMKQCRVGGELRQIGSVLKHFPGYGSNVDTHTGGAVDSRPLETYLEEDFLPFALGIEAGADAVQVCHNTVQCMDPDRPASLSPEVYRILREEVGFSGVILTDDLLMEAVAVYDENGDAALMAITAGADMVVTTDYEKEFARVRRALDEGELDEARLDESVLRILKWKLRQGVIG